MNHSNTDNLTNVVDYHVHENIVLCNINFVANILNLIFGVSFDHTMSIQQYVNGTVKILLLLFEILLFLKLCFLTLLHAVVTSKLNYGYVRNLFEFLMLDWSPNTNFTNTYSTLIFLHLMYYFVVITCL